MLRRPIDVDQAAYAAQKVYADPALRPKAVRLRLAERLWLTRALDFCSECEESVSLVSVVKKYEADGSRVVRPVWDQRRGNLKWMPPPFAPLGSPTAFCHLDLSGIPSQRTLYRIAAGIPDMFTRLEMPRRAWPYFVLGGVDAQELADRLCMNGYTYNLRVGDCFPGLEVLVVGWSWAAFLAHNTLLALLDTAHGPSAGLTRMVYSAPTPK